MINRISLCLLSASLMVSFNFAAQPRQHEEFIEFDINGYFRQHPKAQQEFKETVMRNGNAAWNVAMKTIAHDTLWASGIGGIAMTTLAAIALDEDGSTYIDRINNAGKGLAMGAAFSLPVGLIVGALNGGYQAHQELQRGCDDCGNPAVEHNCNEQHATPYNTAINIGASFSFAYGLVSGVAQLRSPRIFRFLNTRESRLACYTEGMLTGASIATLGVAGYCLYNKYFASKPEDQRIQDTEQHSEQDAEVIRTARTLARDYTRTHKISTLFSPASCTEGLY